MKCAVIGGGWNGIYALKWLVDEGVKDVVLFERLDCIGGTWYHRQEPGGVFDSTRTTASNQYLHASDFPFPMDHNFPHHSEVQNWLQAYIKHFNLVDRIKLSHKVDSLRKVNGKWEVIHTSPAGTVTQEFDKVVVATGVCIPVIPMEQGSVWHPYKGEHYHSAAYKAAKGDPRCEGKTVMIVGGGESASDVAVEVSRVAKNTVVSMRRGVWIYDREFGNGPFDVMTPRMIWCFGWSWYNSQLIRTYKFCLELMFGEGGSGIPDWKPEGPFMRSFFNKSRDMVREVSVGRIQARRGATKVEGKKVWFQGRPQGPEDYIEIDTIIWCSGFKFNFEFFKDDPGWNPTISGYKMVFYPDDPTLAFTGTARPIFGSFLGLCELQCRWIAKVFTGKVALPDAMTMKAVAKADRVWHAETFPKEEQRPYVRCHFHYSDEIAEMIDAKPHLWSEFLRSPRTYLQIMMAPWNAFQYRLNEPAMREVSLQRIKDIYPTDYIAYKQMVWGIWVHFAAVPVILVFALLSLYYAYSRLLA